MPHFLHRRGLLPPEYYSLRAEILLHPLKGLRQFNLSKNLKLQLEMPRTQDLSVRGTALLCSSGL